MPPRRSFDVSVVIPLFNKADYVRSAIESVIGQSCPAKEIIVVDDGSTDGSAAQISDLVENRVRIVTQKNAGPAVARNRGVAEAAGSWIAFLDADDLWLEDHLATLAEVSRAFPAASVVGSQFAFDRPPHHHDSPVDPRLIDFFSTPSTPFYTSSVAVRRSTLQDSGGFGDYWPGEDVELWARLALDNEIAVSPTTTALYRQQTGGLMEQSRERFSRSVEMQPIFNTLDVALADKKYAPRHGAIAGYRDAWLATFARQALVAGRPDIAAAYLRQMQPGSRQGGGLTHVLARLPGPVVRSAMRLRSALRAAAPRGR